jgi:hypothetical protein
MWASSLEENCGKQRGLLLSAVCFHFSFIIFPCIIRPRPEWPEWHLQNIGFIYGEGIKVK